MTEATTSEDILTEAREKMKKAVASIHHQMGAIRTGRANPMLLDRVSVDYYGTPTPVRQIANVSVQEGQTLVIQPYEKSLLAEIEKAISKSDLNLPPNNDGTVLRLNVPPLSEERRQEMVKMVKKIGEEGKVAIRNIRREASTDVDKLKKSANLPEDEVKDRHEDIQKLTDQFTREVDTVVADKEKEVMQV
ncbi:MAG: ribosome recycling factor [Candidatus Melainabacteria bacterium]